MTQGRPKGSKGEIEVAKILEPWWAEHEPLAPDGNPIRFVRTPLSGGWGGKDTRSGFLASGDLMTTAAKFPFSVEVKRREGFAWKPFLDGKKSPVWGWWRQAIEQGKEMRKVPLLWFRKNREPWHVLVPFVAFDACCTDDDGRDFRVSYEAPAEKYFARSTILADFGGQPPVMMSATAFLAVDPWKWAEACRPFTRG